MNRLMHTEADVWMNGRKEEWMEEETEEWKDGKRSTRSFVLIDQSFPFAAQVTRKVFLRRPISLATPGHHLYETSVGTFELLYSQALNHCV